MSHLASETKMANRQTNHTAISTGLIAASISIFAICAFAAISIFWTFPSFIKAQSAVLSPQTSFIGPETSMVFGGEQYSVTGIKPCTHGGPNECIELTPGLNQFVYLRPAGSTAPNRGIVTITGTKDDAGISLKKIQYPDGLEKSFSPALAGTLVK